MLVNSILGLKYIRLLRREAFLEEMEELKKKYSYIFLVSYNQINITGFSVQSKQSIIIDLSAGLDNVFDNFKSNTRKEIRKTFNLNADGLTFVPIDKQINKIYTCYKKFEYIRGWMPALKSEIKNSLVFAAYYQGAVVAGVTCYADENFIRVGKIFSLRYQCAGNKINSQIIGSASRRLIFEICKYGVEHGFTSLDLGGVDFIDQKKIGISEFKSCFGGDTKDVYICRYIKKNFALLKKILFFFERDIT